MSSRTRFPWTARLAAACLVLTPLVANASPEDPPVVPPAGPTPPPGVPGPVYKNPELGVTVQGPAGWALVADRVGAPSWTRLCTFSDPATKAVTIVNARKAQAGTVGRMHAEVVKQFEADKSFSLQSVTDLAPTPQRPLPAVVVDALQSRPLEGGAAAPLGGGATPTVAWRIQAAYFVGTSTEYLVYTQVPATLFSRVQGAIERMRDSFVARETAPSAIPRGEGAYRDEVRGFACSVPAGCGVRVPKRSQHVVEFAPTGEGPVIGVYLYESQLNLDEEAKTLVDYYRGEEVGGEAETAVREVAGRPSAIVMAKGRMEGKDLVFLVSVVKRGTDTFRLRVVADASQAAKAREVFDAFLKSFVVTNA